MKYNVRDLLVNALLKKAKGYLVREKTDEYAVDNDGGKKLVKSRVVTKRSPPDVAACRVLLEMDEGDTDFADMTDEQLSEERRRLLRLLSQSDGEEQT